MLGNKGGTNIVENIRVTLGHNSPNENNGPVFARINVGLQFVFRIYRPNCPHLFLNGNSNNFCNSMPPNSVEKFNAGLTNERTFCKSSIISLFDFYCFTITNLDSKI